MRGKVVKGTGVVILENWTDEEKMVLDGYGAKKIRPLPNELNLEISSGEIESDKFNLLLMDEEAMYLSQYLQFEIMEEEQLIDQETLWNRFVRKNPSFPLKYKTYCFFKSKGYFIRSALNYGLDYSLYRYHPTLCHAEMCLYVINGLSSTESSMTWKHLSCLTRLLPNVNKILLLCYIVPHSSISNNIDITLLASQDLLDVRPVTTLVRRMSMSATCLESHHISEIQRRYYQNSLLSAPRQEKKYIPSSSGPKLTGSQKRKLKRKQREEVEREKNRGNNEDNGEVQESIDQTQDNEIREKKLSKRNAHWNILSQSVDSSLSRQGETVSPKSEQEEVRTQEGSAQENGSFLGWLSSYFQSKS